MTDPNWLKSFKPGDCSQANNTTKSMFDECIFAHPWLPDSANLFDEEALGLVNNMRGVLFNAIKNQNNSMLENICVITL